MELKSGDIRDSILKLQGQLDLMVGLYNQALAEEKKAQEKTNEPVPQDK